MSAPKILIVEDNEFDISLLRLALDDQGQEYELLILEDGEVAIKFFEQQRLSPSVPEPCIILLDLHLPKRDGLEVLRAIRRAPVLQNIHVVLMTSAASPQEEEEIRSMGADYRIKPRELDEVYKLAADVIAICKSFTPTPV